MRRPTPFLMERNIPMTRKPLVSAAVRMVGLPALILAIFAALSSSALADITVKVDLWEKPDASQGITLSTMEAKAGKVSFEVTNTSKAMEHEFLIIKTDMTSDQFPLKDSGTRVDESKLQGMEEFGDLEPGETKTWTTNLTSGRYVLFCNERGHFRAGMHTTFTVTP